MDRAPAIYPVRFRADIHRQAMAMRTLTPTIVTNDPSTSAATASTNRTPSSGRAAEQCAYADDAEVDDREKPREDLELPPIAGPEGRARSSVAVGRERVVPVECRHSLVGTTVGLDGHDEPDDPQQRLGDHEHHRAGFG